MRTCDMTRTYSQGEKSLKFFLNLEKRRGIPGQIRKLIVNNQEIMHQNKIQNELLFFCEIVFRNMSAKTSEDCERFLNKRSVPKFLKNMDMEITL